MTYASAMPSTSSIATEMTVISTVVQTSCHQRCADRTDQ